MVRTTTAKKLIIAYMIQISARYPSSKKHGKYRYYHYRNGTHHIYTDYSVSDLGSYYCSDQTQKQQNA